MKLNRASGILLHPTSLPSEGGIGDFGPSAYAFVDFLTAAGQKVWQILPLGPTGFGDSPYQCFSSFALNPLLIFLEEPGPGHAACQNRIDYGRVIAEKGRRLQHAFASFKKAGKNGDYDAFCEKNAAWLEDYARFTGQPDYQKFLQYTAYSQWMALKSYANQKGILILGDMPIYTALDSADVRFHPELFQLDETGKPIAVAGVPPDYFSETGQLWGNPLYRWEVHAESGFAWWRARVLHSLELYDMLRIDHFRGFADYWSIPYGDADATAGHWEAGPGKALFQALGPLPLIAEDLGIITPEVTALRKAFGLPGMAVLQFAFGSGPDNPHLPHAIEKDTVLYTGTHDNDTALGWFQTASPAERKHFLDYTGTDGSDPAWAMIRLALSSPAFLSVFPLQDLLRLDARGRMNIPNKPQGNWQWRFAPDALTPDIAAQLREITVLFGR